MTVRRLLMGLSVVGGVSIWSVCRGETNPDHAETADPVYVASGTDGGGNHDDAAYRYRTNQSRHWRHIMIGGR